LGLFVFGVGLIKEQAKSREENKMRLVTAKLIKRATEDGLIVVDDHVPVGKEYTIDLDSMAVHQMWNYEKEQGHSKEIVAIVEDGKRAGWVPTEILEFER
jgi:hypothetical protein